MKLVHLIFYSFYKTASWINKYIPLQGGGVGGASGFLALLTLVPFCFVFKFSRSAPLTFENTIKYLFIIGSLSLIIFYFTNNGEEIIKKLNKEIISTQQRMLLANGFLLLYVAVFMYFLK